MKIINRYKKIPCYLEECRGLINLYTLLETQDFIIESENSISCFCPVCGARNIIHINSTEELTRGREENVYRGNF